MEACHKLPPRHVQRCYQCCRHEERILVLAYEQIYPQIRRALEVHPPTEKPKDDHSPGRTRRA